MVVVVVAVRILNSVPVDGRTRPATRHDKQQISFQGGTVAQHLRTIRPEQNNIARGPSLPKLAAKARCLGFALLCSAPPCTTSTVPSTSNRSPEKAVGAVAVAGAGAAAGAEKAAWELEAFSAAAERPGPPLATRDALCLEPAYSADDQPLPVAQPWLPSAVLRNVAHAVSQKVHYWQP